MVRTTVFRGKFCQIQQLTAAIFPVLQHVIY